MDIVPFDALPEAVKGEEINQENGQSADEKSHLASTATVATMEAPQVDQVAGDGRPLKRPATGELLKDKPEVKRRNQRLFGALLGTLQKFKKEEDANQSSAAAQRRAALQQVAEKKSRAASAHYLEKNIHTRLENNRNQPQQRYIHGSTAHRKATHVPFLLKTVTVPSLSWAPREHCPEVDTLLEKQRMSLQAEGKERPPSILKTGTKDGNGSSGGGGNTNRGEEGEIEEGEQEPSVLLEDKIDSKGTSIDADKEKGPTRNNKDEPSESDDDGGGWRVVEDPTAEAFS